MPSALMLQYIVHESCEQTLPQTFSLLDQVVRRHFAAFLLPTTLELGYLVQESCK